MKQDTAFIDWDDVCFIDCETRAKRKLQIPEWGDVTQTSTRRYADSSYPIIITYAYGLEGPVQRWVTEDITRPPRRDELPDDLLDWDGYFAAHNSAFDRAQLDKYLKAGVNWWLDMMFQGAASALPGKLDLAAKAAGHKGKLDMGKALIKKFCPADGDLPEDYPDDWAQFVTYADQDVEAMQHVAASTFPVPMWQWEEFWASERINDIGLPMDRYMLTGGAAIATAYEEQTGERVAEITGGELYSVRQYVKQREWVWERIRGNPFVAEHMVIAERENPDTGEEEFKLKMDRPIITKMIAALNTVDERQGLTDDEWDVLQFLEEREFGASATPAKFRKACNAIMDDDSLPNQYVANGAAQTGRFSSRGVQVHNLTRSTVGSLEDERELSNLMADVGERVMQGDEVVDLKPIEERFGNVGKALSRMVRPSIIAPPDHELVWGDWSNIEARVLPWLADAEERLDVFREIDSDPNAPDVYIRAFGGMYGDNPYELWKTYKSGDKDTEAFKEVKSGRQKGKIAELALGFAGGAGALQSMAAGYGMMFEGSEAQDIVSRWRAANQWAVDFWDELWEAFLMAKKHPEEIFPVGKVAYQSFQYMGKRTIVCYLPDGRPLFYRNIREREYIERDPFDEKIILERTTKPVFDAHNGVKALWKGLLAENITQATAGSVLRWTVRSLDQSEEYAKAFLTRGHTHDEIILQAHKRDVPYVRTLLHTHMMQDYGWNAGLPTGADITSHPYYTKTLDD